ncbi:M15 family metallopeptidase [Defluviitalea saccharophila]|uniref:M15 family metallopeptidase n=1 Tax=Defluviitalea saccharophila TaxID=879970 RepID=A0ABZ2Y5D7_9FIRM
MGKKLAFVFALISIILVSIYSYRLKNDAVSKNTFNEIEQNVEISNTEGGEEMDTSPIDGRLVEYDENIQEEIDIDLIFEELESRKTDQLILVNKWNTLSENYEPETLINIVKDIPSSKSELWLQESAYQAVKELFDAANSEGLTGLRAVSGYRPYSYQNQLYNAKVNSFSNQYDLETARMKASEVVAIPGTSEHQTGLALDMSSLELLRTADPLVEEFKNTPEGQWLYNNSWKYGFVLRYLPEKKDITGIISEPWHFRYVGMPHAEYMTKHRLSLEEYINDIKEEKMIIFEDFNGNKYQIYYVQKENHDILLSDLFNAENLVNVSEIGQDEYIITQKID